MANVNYLKAGDYFMPDIQLSVVGDTPLGKYARMRREFLEVNNPLLLSDLILTEKLFPHLWEVQQTCERRMELLMNRLIDKNPAQDKATQQLAWVQHMNMLKAQAEESVLHEIVYCL